MQTRVQRVSFYSSSCQKINSKIGLEYGLFSQIVEFKQTIIREKDTARKIEIKQKNQYSNFKDSQHDQKIVCL